MSIHDWYKKEGLYIPIEEMCGDDVMRTDRTFAAERYVTTFVAGGKLCNGKIVMLAGNTSHASAYEWRTSSTANESADELDVEYNEMRFWRERLQPVHGRCWSVSLLSMDHQNDLLRIGAALHELPVALFNPEEGNTEAAFVANRFSGTWRIYMAAAYMRLGNLPPVALLRDLETPGTVNRELYDWVIEGGRAALALVRTRLELVEANLSLMSAISGQAAGVTFTELPAGSAPPLIFKDFKV